MAAKEFQKQWFARDTRDPELVAILIERGEVTEPLANADGVVCQLLRADVNERAKDYARESRDERGNSAEPAGAFRQRKDSEACTQEPARDETTTITGDVDASDSDEPERHRSGNEEEGRETENIG